MKLDGLKNEAAPQWLKDRLSVSMGPVDAPVLKDMFGEEGERHKDARRFYSFAKVDGGYIVESVEFKNMCCAHCGASVKVNAETEMDYLEPAEQQLMRLCIDELEGR